VTDTRYLVHGVFWDGPPAVSAASDGGRPVLCLQHRSGVVSEMALDAGTRPGFRVADGARRCLGHTRVFSAAERRHVTCPDVVNFWLLKGRLVEPGEHTSEVPAVQEALF
jgi:hypothetical protein